MSLTLGNRLSNFYRTTMRTFKDLGESKPVIKKNVQISVNGKDIDPDSVEGKKIQAQVDQTVKEIDKSVEYMRETIKKWTK